MSDGVTPTPRTDAAVLVLPTYFKIECVAVSFARQLELELAEAVKKRDLHRDERDLAIAQSDTNWKDLCSARAALTLSQARCRELETRLQGYENAD